MKTWREKALDAAERAKKAALDKVDEIDLDQYKPYLDSARNQMDKGIEKISVSIDQAKDSALERVDAIDLEQYQPYVDSARNQMGKGVEKLSVSIDQAKDSVLAKQVADHYQRLVPEAQSAVQKFVNQRRSIKSDTTSLTEEEKIERSIEALEGKDRIGLLGEGFVVALGAAGGAAASGVIAGAAGATTLLGSSFLGSALGGVFVTATPVGWVLAPALIMGAAGYGTAKFIRSGANQDKVRAELIASLTGRLAALKTEQPEDTTALDELNRIAAVCVAGGVLDESALSRMMSLIEAGRMNPSIATDRLTKMALEAELITAAK